MKKMWFKRKLYGWGWDPATWEGWVATVLCLLLACGTPLGLVLFFDLEQNPEKEAFVVLLAIGIPIVVTLLFLWICYLKGEKPLWQWGERVEDEDE